VWSGCLFGDARDLTHPPPQEGRRPTPHSLDRRSPEGGATGILFSVRSSIVRCLFLRFLPKIGPAWSCLHFSSPSLNVDNRGEFFCYLVMRASRAEPARSASPALRSHCVPSSREDKGCLGLVSYQVSASSRLRSGASRDRDPSPPSRPVV